ncbi:protein IQ-DOMAIN 9-like [Curcuma longa]|uniref:protein IQ-DOMAIN 9-like n=1 Tax=Curcuma longa TaxID=136217 RepID=UPI003D9EBAE2
MGSGDWFKAIIHRKKAKKARDSSKPQPNGFKLKNQASDRPNKLVTAEDVAAIRIQTSFRRFRARRDLRNLKRMQRLQVFTHRKSVQKQAPNTLRHVQLWSKMQMQIRARRGRMVVEGRIRQKKHENQLKREAKLQDLEVEWNGSTETKDEIIARIQQREEAAVKRERAMAYAFSHQWRASSGMNQGPFVYELAKGNWEWSWVDKWIAAQPWESRPSARSSKLAGTNAKVSRS